MKLADIKAGMTLRIPAQCQPVVVTAAIDRGAGVLEIHFTRSDGAPDHAVLFEEDEDQIEALEERTWSMDGNPDELRLALEAHRIKLAHLFDPYMAVRNSSVEPLPHQISAVYEKMLPRLPLRYVLADDPGAGKTVMAGLLIKEMMARGALKRCLIVCPGSLVEQWQDELSAKFGLDFRILTNDFFEAAGSGNAFLENDLCIGRLDKLSRDEAVQARLREATWDLVVVDEAHKMSVSVYGQEPKKTKRYQLGELLGETTENLLLMTATPHNGKAKDFQYFMALVDRDRFAGAEHLPPAKRQQNAMLVDDKFVPVDTNVPDVSDLMRRLVKEDLRKFNGDKLFPPREARTLTFELSPEERGLYDAVTEYVSTEFNRADQLDGKRKNSVGFALTVLQRRLASSPEAIYQSLSRRRKRLEQRLAEARAGVRAVGWEDEALQLPGDDFDDDDYEESEFEGAEDELADSVTASKTVAELEMEIDTLRRLERMAEALRNSGRDRKWEELSRTLQEAKEFRDDDGTPEKLIVFTEHRDTLSYLAERLRSLLGRQDAVITISGGMSREERRRAEQRFKQDKDVRVLVATDAAGEGINLQRAHLMVNYDMPWNPNRLEQRFGRIHRIGQTKVCYLWNLVAAETREGAVFQRLLQKLDEERSALGGRVFDVLGSVTFGSGQLRDLLIKAIREGADPEVVDDIGDTVAASLDREKLEELMRRNALVPSFMDNSDVERIRDEMEEQEAKRLEPHFIEDFFLEATERLNGKAVEREQDRYEVTKVPFSVRERDTVAGRKVLDEYERVCFAKEDVEGAVPADLLAPGHPLLDSTVEVALDRWGGLLRQGSVFVDEQDETDAPRALLFLETDVQDGTLLSDGSRRVVSRQVRFVEVSQDGSVRDAGYAPHLDYESATPEEARKALSLLDGWSLKEAEDQAIAYAYGHIVRQQAEAEKVRRGAVADKTEVEVTKRLMAEMRYWDRKAHDIAEKEKQGKSPRLNSAKARKRVGEMRGRLESRRETLAKERQVTACPPRVIGGALVVPRALLAEDADEPFTQATVEAKRRVELAAMEAVMAIERELGYEPSDVSKENRGWDVQSRRPHVEEGQKRFRFIEVKGRAAGSKTVTVTKGEVLGALNNRENFILALVEVDGDRTRATYVETPFVERLTRGQVSGNFSIDELKEIGHVVYEGDWR